MPTICSYEMNTCLITAPDMLCSQAGIRLQACQVTMYNKTMVSAGRRQESRRKSVLCLMAHVLDFEDGKGSFTRWVAPNQT